MLDPALLRSGRLDRKIELPVPNEDARARIMQIHSRRMNVNKEDVNFPELARMSEDFNGRQELSTVGFTSTVWVLLWSAWRRECRQLFNQR